MASKLISCSLRTLQKSSGSPSVPLEVMQESTPNLSQQSHDAGSLSRSDVESPSVAESPEIGSGGIVSVNSGFEAQLRRLSAGHDHFGGAPAEYTQTPQRSRPRRSGTCTPWNPQNLAIGPDGERTSRRNGLANTISHVLGDFPVEEERKEAEKEREKQDTSECRAKGLQEPLWFMAGLAKRGWALQEGKGKRKRAEPQRKVLSSTSLPADEAQLLQKWTAEALEDVENQQKQYFQHGVYASKCDVAPALDPIHHGLVTEQRAQVLFQVSVDDSRLSARIFCS